VYDAFNPYEARQIVKRARGELKAGVLPDLIGYRLRVAQQAVFRDFAAQVGELSPGRAGIMLLIEAWPKRCASTAPPWWASSIPSKGAA